MNVFNPSTNWPDINRNPPLVARAAAAITRSGRHPLSAVACAMVLVIDADYRDRGRYCT